VHTVDELMIDTPRGPVAATRTGRGPVVVLVAGLGSTRAIWGDLPRVLGRSFTAVALDNRGVGGSRAGDAFTLDGAAEDVWTAVDAVVPGGRAAILGASMGGAVALAAALAAPGRVSGLVVASAAARLSRHGRRSLELLRDLLLHLPAQRVGQALMTLAFAPTFHERFPGFVDEASALYGLDPLDVPGALAQVSHLRKGWDFRRRLDGIQAPALVLAGGRDPVVAREDTEELAHTMPHAELVELEGAAHSVLAEGGGEILERTVGFLTATAG
jgi:pimeloyl-ACP methyl ester carboxylesterase